MKKEIPVKKSCNSKNKAWLEGIMNRIPSIRHVFAYHNADCVKCKVLEKDMVRVGVFVMCPKCFDLTFHSDNPVVEEREEYLKWLDVYQKSIGE